MNYLHILYIIFMVLSYVLYMILMLFIYMYYKLSVCTNLIDDISLFFTVFSFNLLTKTVRKSASFLKNRLIF
jgi:hypothetical protein